MPTPLHAVVFDFDGLILDTESPEVEAWEHEFESHGLTMDRSWWREITGRGAELVHTRPEEILETKLGRKLDVASVLERVNRRRLQRIFSNPILPGVLELIGLLQAEGIPLGVASSSKHAWVDSHLDRLGLDRHFPVVVCADDVQRAKPFPDLYMAACAALGVSPEQCVALEDSENGIRAGKAASMAVLACPNPVTMDFDLSMADLVVRSLSEVDLDVLRNLP